MSDMTLAQMNLLTEDELQAGVIDEVIDISDVAAQIPFRNIEGKSFLYVRESTVPTADFVDINEVIPQKVATYAQVSLTLKQLIADTDTPRFAVDTKSDINDIRANNVSKRLKGIVRKWEDSFFYGNNTTSNLEID